MSIRGCTRCSTSILRAFIHDISGLNLQRSAGLSALSPATALDRVVSPHATHSRRLLSNTNTSHDLRHESDHAAKPHARTSNKHSSGAIQQSVEKETYSKQHEQRGGEVNQEKAVGEKLQIVEESPDVTLGREHKRLLRKLQRLQEGKHPLRNSVDASYQQQVARLNGRISNFSRNSSGVNKPELEGTNHISTPTSTFQRSTTKIDSRSSVSDISNLQVAPKKIKREDWQTQKNALAAKFGSQLWRPNKRISPDALEGIRSLHASDPKTYSTPVLAEHFAMSSEAIRRILKSKWKPNAEEADKRAKRWEERGRKKWADMAALGLKPPVKWRAMGIQRAEDVNQKVNGQRGL